MENPRSDKMYRFDNAGRNKAVVELRSVPISRIITDLIILILLWIPIPAIFVFIQPWPHGFYCSDITIRYPFRKGTVSSTMLYTVGSALPIILIFAVEGYRFFVLEPRVFGHGERAKAQYSLRGRSVHPFASALYIHLGYFLFGMALNFLMTSVGKHTIGRLRPHFLDVCRPNLTKVCANPYAYVMGEDMGCTGDVELTKQARLSFPSGHTSFAFYTMVYLILYLQARLIWPVGGLLSKHTLQFGAILLAGATGLTRVSDYKHHWSDVLAGFLLGTGMAFITAYGMAGLFRRPNYIFAKPSPYDTRYYTGGQLYGDFGEEMKATEENIIEQKKDAV